MTPGLADADHAAPGAWVDDPARSSGLAAGVAGPPAIGSVSPAVLGGPPGEVNMAE
jgi:hypothetical protein